MINCKTQSEILKEFWKPPHIAQLKWNIDASQIITKKLSIISYVCRDGKRRIIHSTGMRIRDIAVLLAEVISVYIVISMNDLFFYFSYEEGKKEELVNMWVLVLYLGTSIKS